MKHPFAAHDQRTASIVSAGIRGATRALALAHKLHLTLNAECMFSTPSCCNLQSGRHQQFLPHCQHHTCCCTQGRMYPQWQVRCRRCCRAPLVHSIASKLWRFSFSFVLKATGAKKISEFQDFASPTASVAELMGTFSD